MHWKGRVLAISPLLVPAAAAQSPGRVSFTDAAGDGELDILSVTAASNAQGGITFVAHVSPAELADDQWALVYIDEDANPSTGVPDYPFPMHNPSKGAEVQLEVTKYEGEYFFSVYRFDGHDWVRSQAPSAYGYVFNGVRFAINKRDLRMTSHRLRFSLVHAGGDPATSLDALPSGGGLVDYRLSTAPLALSVARFAPDAKKVQAGGRYGVRMQLHRSDLDELTSADTVACTAKVRKRKVRVRGGFDGDVATCSGKTPKFARGKRLKVKATVQLDGVKVSRAATIRVRR